jgi:hypothetical protein
MTNLFEDDEIDPRESEFIDTVDDDPAEEATEEEVVASLEQESPDASYDALDLECEKRFEVAMYYRTLLKGRLFNEHTEASEVVEAEARVFFKERLETLLGIRAPKQVLQQQQLPFDKEEIAALKAVAKRLVKKPELIEAKQPPTLRQSPVPAKAPTRAAPVVPTRPQQARAVSKATAKPNTKPTTKSNTKPTTKPNIPALKPNDIIEDTGKIVHTNNGKIFRVVKNEFGTEFKKDITGQGNPPGQVPMPCGEMLGRATEASAAKQISNLNIGVRDQNGTVHHVGVQDLANKVSEEN